MNNALLSSKSGDHGTPLGYVEIARYVLGQIDQDPCSSPYWNHWGVRAKSIYTAEDDALAERNHFFGNVLMNPPSYTPEKGSGEERVSVRPFYEKLVDYWSRGEVNAAVYVVFSLNQLTMLQSSPVAPLTFATLFPRERGRFLQRGENNGPPIAGEQPTHGNALVLMPSRRDDRRAMMRRFIEASADLENGGSLVRPF